MSTLESIDIPPTEPPSSTCSCVNLYKLLKDRVEALERRLDGGETSPPIQYNFPRREKEVWTSVLRQAGLSENIRYDRIINEWVDSNVRARMEMITEAINSGRQDLRYLPRNVITIPASYQVTRAITEARLDFQ